MTFLGEVKVKRTKQRERERPRGLGEWATQTVMFKLLKEKWGRGVLGGHVLLAPEE